MNNLEEITNYNGEQITTALALTSINQYDVAKLISDLSKGLYFVKLITADKISVGKLVVE